VAPTGRGKGVLSRWPGRLWTGRFRL